MNRLQPLWTFALAALLAAFLLTGHTSIAEPPKRIGGVVVYGDLSQAEHSLLRQLKRRLVPLPDTIRVKYREDDFGFYKKGSSTIILASRRHRSPAKSQPTPAYIYGRRTGSATLPPVGDYYTLAHEIGHYLQWRIFNGQPLLKPPMWWNIDGLVNPYRARVETEADLMAAALGAIVFDTPTDAFGYPREIWAGNVHTLARTYKARILDFYRVTNP